MLQLPGEVVELSGALGSALQVLQAAAIVPDITFETFQHPKPVVGGAECGVEKAAEGLLEAPQVHRIGEGCV